MAKTGCSTRDRVLQAAFQLFAERGFEGATTQEICSLAQANIAAVNYHYGSKENLYRAVWEHGSETAQRVWDERMSGATTAEERLRGFVEMRVAAVMSNGEDSWFPRLIHWEFTNPSPLHVELRDRYLLAKHQWFGGLIREIVGEGVSERIARLAGFCIHSPLIHLREMQSNRRSAPPPDGGPMADPRALVDTLCTFALGGLRELRRQHEQGRG